MVSQRKSLERNVWFLHQKRHLKPVQLVVSSSFFSVADSSVSILSSPSSFFSSSSTLSSSNFSSTLNEFSLNLRTYFHFQMLILKSLHTPTMLRKRFFNIVLMTKSDVSSFPKTYLLIALKIIFLTRTLGLIES